VDHRDQLFVVFAEACDCGAAFEVQARVDRVELEFGVGFEQVACPNCHAPHYVPALPVRVSPLISDADF